MKTEYSLLIWLLTCVGLHAQTEKGIVPVTPSRVLGTLPTPHSTRAVVVGVSDYQSPAIPDLQFAHQDAMEFEKWLKSPAGGKVPEDNIRLLIEDGATNNAVMMALYELIEVCRPGDLAIFYFSGHGDLEAKIRNQPGFLLTYDSPPKVYASSAIDLRQLNDVVSTLADNQVRTVLITDACHAGKLAGSTVGGTQSTALALKEQFSSAAKIMSCQPDELSIESVQWGGGRGLFSYYLVDGLMGLADRDGNNIINLFEIGRYLEDSVSAYAAPHPQMPMYAGDRNFQLANVDAQSLAAHKGMRFKSAPGLEKFAGKGLEDEILARVDSLTRVRYRAFQHALEGSDLLSVADSSANSLFNQLISVDALRPLHGIMRRNLAVALLDEVQQALNALLADDPYEANNWRGDPAKYEQYPDYLQRAMELLGEGHHMCQSIRSRKCYFEGYLFTRKTLDMSDAAARDSLREIAKNKFLEAAALEPGAAYIYHAIGSLYFVNFPLRTDSMMYWHNKAIELAPTWKMPYLDLSYEYQLGQSDLKQSEYWLMKAAEQDPHSYVVLERTAWLYQWLNRTQEALNLCDTMIALKPGLFNAYSTKGVTHLMRNEFPEAEDCFNRSLELEPKFPNWAILYKPETSVLTRQWPKGKIFFDNIFTDEKNDGLVKSYAFAQLIGVCLFSKKQVADLEPYAKSVIEFAAAPSPMASGYCGLAAVRFWEGHLSEATELFIKAIETDPTPSSSLICANTFLAMIAEKEGRFVSADSLFQAAFIFEKVISALDKAFIQGDCRLEYGRFLMRQGRLEDAREQFRLAEAFQPKCYQAQYGYALLAASKKRYEEALDYLEKALDYWYPDAASILKEPLFKKIRKTKRFKTMMQKHFPNAS